jgi:saccharopine dehydrogenase (NAD+, L-lysine-forming)
MTHIWVRAEHRDNEARVGLTPSGASALLADGYKITVERSENRIIPDADYENAGCHMAACHSWPTAPVDAVIFGLKELPDDQTPLTHRHIMFGHAFKGQPAGLRLLHRFKSGGGTLLDLEYLTDASGRRVAAFGYWAGYAGAAVAIKCWISQQRGQLAGPVHAYKNAHQLLAELQGELVAQGSMRPSALVIGALGRVGTGVADLCTEMGVAATRWDMAETASGGPFPEILAHDLFFNCILARPGTPVFISADTGRLPRRLSVIGDIACDPESDFSPIKVYDQVTTWSEPATRVHEAPPLDVTAIDNLPSMLPLESSEDFASQLLPSLKSLKEKGHPVWEGAMQTYLTQIDQLRSQAKIR